jgi:Flp pilus assembly pilin Flp
MLTPPARGRRPGAEESQAGQGLVEYALILALIMLVAVASVAFFGSALASLLSSIGSSVP